MTMNCTDLCWIWWHVHVLLSPSDSLWSAVK